MKLKNNDMNEYFELYRILEDGGVEHIDQIRIRDKNIFQNIYANFKELRDYVNTVYCNIYDVELKKYLINTDIGNEYIIKHFSAAHKDLNIIEDESIEIRQISEVQYIKFNKRYDNQYQLVDHIINEKQKEDKETIITEDILINSGFEYNELTSRLMESYQKNNYGIDNYKELRKLTNDVDNQFQIKLDIDNGYNNRGSKWHIHIDNDACETIGSADINTVYEFNLLMEIFGSKFRL